MHHASRLAALLALALGALVIAPLASAWTVTLNAQPSMKRTHHWSIEKSVSQSAVSLAPGQTTNVTYSVTVKHTGTADSNWAVSGTMEMTEDPDIAIGSVAFKILPTAGGEILAGHTCTPTLPSSLGSGLECTYTAALPGALDGQTWMRANVSSPVGFRNAFAPYSFANATIEHVDECVDVTDTMAGNLGTVCVGDAPKTFTYTKTVGGYMECGDFVVDNTASFRTNDTGATGSAGATVDINVNCTPPTSGCTRTIGYWKTHAGFGPQADVVTALLPIWLGTAGGAKSINVTTAAKAVSLLSMKGSNDQKAASNGINKLYAQLLGAKLSGKNGASSTSILSTIAAADAFLATHDSLSWDGLSASQKATVLGWMETLDDYNNGLIGPKHCE